jgi:futalosine hydrolase
MIALLCAVPKELKLLRASLRMEESVALGSKIFLRGTISGQEAILCAGGMGKANAAHAAAILITRFQPSALIIFGVGGAYPSSGANVGDIALASEEIDGDEGVLTSEGFKDTEYIGIPLIRKESAVFYNRFPSCKKLFAAAHKILSPKKMNGRIHTGRFVTISTCTGTSARAKELEERYKALCENMEGAAAAQAAMLHGIPWLEVRGISNIVEERDLKKWEIPRAAQAAQEAVQHIMEGWSR